MTHSEKHDSFDFREYSLNLCKIVEVVSCMVVDGSILFHLGP